MHSLVIVKMMTTMRAISACMAASLMAACPTSRPRSSFSLSARDAWEKGRVGTKKVVCEKKRSCENNENKLPL